MDLGLTKTVIESVKWFEEVPNFHLNFFEKRKMIHKQLEGMDLP